MMAGWLKIFQKYSTPSPVKSSVANTATKPIIAKRLFQISACGENPHTQSFRRLVGGSFVAGAGMTEGGVFGGGLLGVCDMVNILSLICSIEIDG